eukprot:scaffold1289_cov274-Pinguiococcus_pyrenoidosus.AAC.25
MLPSRDIQWERSVVTVVARRSLAPKSFAARIFASPRTSSASENAPVSQRAGQACSPWRRLCGAEALSARSAAECAGSCCSSGHAVAGVHPRRQRRRGAHGSRAADSGQAPGLARGRGPAAGGA